MMRSNPWREILQDQKRLVVRGEWEVHDAFAAGLCYGAGLGALLIAVVEWLL